MKRKFTLIILIALLFTAGRTKAQGPGLLINEVDYDQVGTDTSEFVELYNSTGADLDLSNYWLILVNGFNATPYDTIFLPSFQLSPAGFFVICGDAGVIPLCDMVLPAHSNIVQNGSPDAIAVWDNTNSAIVDVLSYEGDVTGYVEGTGVPTTAADTAGANYNFLGISRFPDGNDTQDNSADFIQACVTPGAANTNVNSGCLNPLSVSSIKPVNKLSLFPNPAVEKVSLFGLPSARADWQVSVYDLTGKVSLQRSCKPVNGIINLDISGLYNGIYMISASNEEHPEFKGKLKLTVYR